MSEVYNFVWSLDDLHEVLQDKGFALSWTATYCRLLPANARHKDGKSLVYTVPVKLLRPHNDLSKKTPWWLLHYGTIEIYKRTYMFICLSKRVFSIPR